MNCRVCGDPYTALLPFGVGWYRCDKCGSDSRDGGPTNYDAPYLERYIKHTEFEANLVSHRANLDWFVDHSPDRRGTFLDVGCADGAAIEGMSRRGWSPIGFDINPAIRSPHPTIVAPAFKAWFVPQVDCLLCREVIEHVEDWRSFLGELCTAVKRAGLLQIQTPQPHEFHENIYQEDHLQIFKPGILEALVAAKGFDIIESRRWAEVQAGQVFIARKR